MEVVGIPDAAVVLLAQPQTWTDLPSALAAVHGKLTSYRQLTNLVTPPLSFLGHLFDVGVPLVFFKEFRAVSNATDACFQAVTEVSVEVNLSTFQGGFLPGNYQLNIESLASQPLATDLGLTSQPSIVSFWIQMDMVFGFGTNVYSIYANQ